MTALTKLEKAAVSHFLETLRKQQGENFQKAVLFGSRSRGEGDENSDVDILVLLKTVDPLIKNQVWDLANDIFLDTEVDLSPLVMSEVQFQLLRDRERLIAREIDAHGIAL